jgi:hypothetical protein
MTTWQPNWSNAPKHAQYYAVNPWGLAWWYETQPEKVFVGEDGEGFWTSMGQRVFAGMVQLDVAWVFTLVERPA